MAYVALSLMVIGNQVDAAWPGRDKGSDGTWGDARHAAENPGSDHFPNSDGVVTARDFTDDPLHGLDIRRLADALVASKDPRIKYIICQGRILDTRVGNHPWQWVPYYGKDRHYGHLHLSVLSGPLADDQRPWSIGLTQEVDDMDQNSMVTGATDVTLRDTPASVVTRPLRWWLSAPYAHVLAGEDLLRAMSNVLAVVAKGVASIDALDDQTKAEVAAAEAAVAVANAKLDALAAALLPPAPPSLPTSHRA